MDERATSRQLFPVDDDALAYSLLSSVVDMGPGSVHEFDAAGERPASPPHSRRPPTACSPGRLTLLSLLPVLPSPQRAGDEAQHILGVGRIGCHAWARAWLRDVSPNTDSNHALLTSESVEGRGGPIVCAQATARLFSGGRVGACRW
jgi:hypothetical protein